jgi:hypothetical protein
MRPSGLLLAQGLRMTRSIRRLGWRSHLLFVFFGFALLFVQASHPALHPHEVIDPDADWQHACPLSHAATALLIALPLLLCGGLSLGRLRGPLSWLAHSHFIHCLASRPPPAYFL